MFCFYDSYIVLGLKTLL